MAVKELTRWVTQRFVSILLMPLLNVTVVSSNRGHIPWTVVQIEPGLTFVQLFQKILSGSHPMLVIEDQALSQSALDKVLLANAEIV